MRKIKSGKIRWAIDIILVVMAAAAFCIAFIPSVEKDMVLRLGSSAYMVFPVLLVCISILLAVRLYCVEVRKMSK